MKRGTIAEPNDRGVIRLTLFVTPSVYQRLLAEAKRKGEKASEVVQRLLRDSLPR